MNLGSLSKNLMKKTIDFAGDGAESVSIILISNVVYNPSDGSHTKTETTLSIGDGLKSAVSTQEKGKYGLETSSYKVLVSMLDYVSSSADDPNTWDKVMIGTETWQIETVIKGPFNESLCFYICQPA